MIPDFWTQTVLLVYAEDDSFLLHCIKGGYRTFWPILDFRQGWSQHCSREHQESPFETVIGVASGTEPRYMALEWSCENGLRSHSRNFPTCGTTPLAMMMINIHFSSYISTMDQLAMAKLHGFK